MNIKKIVRSIVYERNMLSLVGNLSYAFFGFISFIILTRSLTKEEFGLYVLYVTTGTFIDLFRFGLTRNAIVRFLSGAKGEERVKIIGSSMLIGSGLVVIIAIVIYLLLFLFKAPIENSGFKYFFYFYPLLAVSNLFWNNAVSILQSWQAFGRILFLRMVNIVSFVIFLIVNVFYLKMDVVAIIWANIGANMLSSMLSLVKKWDGTEFILKSTKKNIREIIDFGKYAVGTMLGSSLLRSADTFLLGLATFMGPVAVAKYVIPLKLTELLEIPLRSFMATAFPKLSKASVEKKRDEWKEIFYSYGGAISLLFIPFTILLFIFAQPIVLLLGGNIYRDSLEELTLIFRIFTIYGLILPLDRISGVALDSINKPDRNLRKVIFMAVANIIGDLIAIYYFQSLFWVAMATILNTIVGLFMGYYYLEKYETISYRKFLINGIQFFVDLKNKGMQMMGR